MKKRIIIILPMIAIIFIIIGFILLNKNEEIAKEGIKILDATYNCAPYQEKFYEDDEYIYSFECVKSNSVYVKFEDGSKMLVKTALEEKKVSIDKLIDAGLEVIKKEK